MKKTRINMRGNHSLLDCFDYLSELKQNKIYSRSELLKDALQYVIEHPEIDFSKVQKLKIKNYVRENLPENISFYIEGDLLQKGKELVQKDFPSSSRVNYPFLCRMVLTAYVHSIIEIVEEAVYHFMSWNTALYVQANNFGGTQAHIDIQRNRKVFSTIKKHVDKKNGIAILQEIPYRLNEDFENHKKGDIHPVFSDFMNVFTNEYDILFDSSNDNRIMQTVVVAKKGILAKTKNKDVEYSNRFYEFFIPGIGINCLAVHSKIKIPILIQWIQENTMNPFIIAGDFNAGNYLLENKVADAKITANRKDFLVLLEGRIDLFQGMETTKYKRQIDHVLIQNVVGKKKFDYSDIFVDYENENSDHYPLYWSMGVPKK